MKEFFKKMISLQFVKFCITGGLGLITDAGIYHLIKVSFGVENWFLIDKNLLLTSRIIEKHFSRVKG